MPSYSSSNAKSLHHDLPAYVTFINRTDFPVDVAWVNYNGNLVRYKNKMAPGGRYHMNTFLTHPWVAWNSETKDKLVMGGQFIFDPQPWRGERNRTVVFIDRPVLPLLKLCIQKIRLLVEVDNVESLEIPTDLYAKLKKRNIVNFQDCSTINRQ